MPYKDKERARESSCRAQKRMFDRRKSLSLCVDCGLPSLPNHVLCSGCINKRKEKYIKQIKQGICPKCGGLAIPRHTYCNKCGEKNRLKSHQYRIINHESVLDSNHERYNRYKKEGICHSCGGKSDKGINLCVNCTYKASIYQRKYRRIHGDDISEKGKEQRREWLSQNKCYRCGAPLIEGETKYCFACMAKQHSVGIKGVLKYETAG